MALLETRGLGKTFPGVVALDGVNLAAEAAEVHALVGANGAGKSTLMHILTGVFPATRGSVHLAGQQVRFASPHDAVARGISAVYQEPGAIPQLTVARNVYLGREPRGRCGLIDRRRLRADTRTLVERHRLDLDPDALVEDLSLAQRQMVDIARALSFATRVMILDEPTAALSPPEQEKLFAIIAGLKASGLLTLYVSHRLEELFAIADRISVLRDGRLIATIRAAEATPAALVRLMIGRDAASTAAARPAATSGPPRLRLTRRTGDAEWGLAIRPGEILGLAGLVGSGRSRIARSLIGLDRTGDISVELDGRPVRLRSPRQALAAGIVYLTEDRKGSGIFPPLSITTNATAAALPRFSPWGVMISRSERRAAASVLDRLRLVARSHAVAISELSGGNQQKVLFARALLCRPRVLICDEPTRGIDIATREQIYAIIAELAADGLAVILISSEFAELLAVCHRLAVVRDGRIAAEFPAAAVDEHGLLLAATGTAPAQSRIG